MQKVYIWNPATCSCENNKYLGSTIDDSVITCDEILEMTKTALLKTVPTNFNENIVTCKAKNFYTLLTFSVITIALLITVSIYCYLIKYRAKQKQLLLHHVTNNKLKEVLY